MVLKKILEKILGKYILFTIIVIMDKKKYREVVDVITKTSLKHEGWIVNDGYEVDHIFPVSYGYIMGIPTHVIGNINNLQILKKEENLKKSNKCDSIPMFIQQYILGITKEKIDKEYKQIKMKGIELAKKRGVYKGRYNGSTETLEQFISKPKNKIAMELLKNGKHKKIEISRITNLHVNTITKISKYIKEYNL
jgi:hypothetical protein